MVVSIVTGGAGFIGSWICESLLQKGHKVLCIDNLITGKENNIKHLKTSNNFIFINHDVSKPININDDVNFVFHFASPASPPMYAKYSIETMLVNSIGTLNMLNITNEKNARFILASTSEVYGNPLERPQNEDYWGNVNPIGPRSCYDESKRFAESLTINFSKKYNNDFIIARIFNTYGPRMDPYDGRVVPNFITQALSGKDITIYGNGDQTRSFCYISDLVKGILLLAFSDDTGIFNIGSTEEYTILDTANLILAATDSKSSITFHNIPKDDPEQRCPDIEKIKKIGWKPTIKFEYGIQKTIEYFTEYLKMD